MFTFDWDITIGGKSLQMLDSVEVVHNIKVLADTAVIRLPLYNYGKPVEGLDSIVKGLKVAISLGYNGKKTTEFVGYILKKEVLQNDVIIYCEDELFLFRKALDNAVYKDISIGSLVKKMVAELGMPLNVVCNISLTYDKFTVSNTTGYGVLQKLAEDSACNIYVNGSSLHIHPAYQKVFGETIYNPAYNIEKLALTYKTAEERKVWVVVEGMGKDGKKLTATAGSTGGVVTTMKIGGIKCKEELQKVANNLATQRGYEGYEGTFTTWLYPYCSSGYSVEMTDADFKERNGKYYATGVVTKFSREGASRIVSISKKL